MSKMPASFFSAKVVHFTIVFLFVMKVFPDPNQRAFTIRYLATVHQIPLTSKKLNLWIPLPSNTKHQKITDIQVISTFEYDITEEKEYGNRMVYLSIEDPKDSVQIELNYSVLRSEMNKQSGFEKNNHLLKTGTKAYSLMPISDSLALIAQILINGAQGNRQKARQLYDHCIATMSYDKSGSGWGEGDFLYACDIRKGNCTDFHTLFMGFCRNLKIPTVFEIGLSVPPEPSAGKTGSYHCWALFGDNNTWIPVDISEAWKDSTKRQYFFGSLDENRLMLSRGRDIILSPPQKNEPLNFFIDPYAEIDNEPFVNVSKVTFYEPILQQR